MTQQPYGYPPQQQYPQQPAQAPMPNQQQFQPQFPQAPQGGYPQQGYPAPQMPQQQVQQPLANGGIDDFYSQPNLGGGPGVSWKGKPDGYTVQGIVPRDVGDGDVQQEVGAPNTAQAGIPQTFRDGRPKFVMTVPLQVAQSPDFPEGEARLFVRGQLKDELTRAMAEAGEQGAPRGGSYITVTLVQRKQGRGAIPMNVFRVVYTPAGQQPPAVNQPQQPVQQAYQQPQQQYAQAPAQQFAQPPVQQQAPVQQYAQQGAPQGVPQQQAPAQQYQQPVQQQAQPTGAPSPAPMAQQPAPQGGMQVPPDFNADQAALLGQLTQQAG